MVEMIATNGLTKRFGSITAVDRLNLTVVRGEVLGFLGPNGAGKSTTMKMITGFLRPSAGSASICGFDVLDKPVEARRRLGYLPEGAPLYGDMTAWSFLSFVAATRGLSGASAKRAIDRVTEMTQLRNVFDQPIETLSKGFKRRVGLAQALLHDPEVLILDEPTDGLDPNQKHEVRQLISQMAPEKAIIISTHLLDEVDAVCTRAVIIAGGRIVADGTPAMLAASSRYHNAVSVTVPRAIADSVRPALESLDVVAAVEQQAVRADSVRLTVLPRDGRPVFGNISQLVQAHGWPGAEVRAQSGELEDVFRSVTTTGDMPPRPEPFVPAILIPPDPPAPGQFGAGQSGVGHSGAAPSRESDHA